MVPKRAFKYHGRRIYKTKNCIRSSLLINLIRSISLGFVIANLHAPQDLRGRFSTITRVASPNSSHFVGMCAILRAST